jgi:hypothetical protein
MRPRLLVSNLTGRVYVVTRYSTVGETVVASTKYDVTLDFWKLVEAMVQPGSDPLVIRGGEDEYGHPLTVKVGDMLSDTEAE